jgi:Subtilase family
MKWNHLPGVTAIPFVKLSLLAIFLFCACTKRIYIHDQKQNNCIPSKWLDWNIMFSPGMNEAARLQEMNNLEQFITDYITKFNTTHGTFFSVSQSFVFCPCDSLLYNYNAIPITGSGSVAVPPTNPHSKIPGSGDTVLFVSNNIPMEIDTIIKDSANLDTAAKVYLHINSINPGKTLAIMDTGLDSTLFQNQFTGLLWNDPNGPTLRNFLFFSNGRAQDYYADDDGHKHGTAVTALALKAAENHYPGNEIFPKVMVLKVLDNNRIGSSFSVSCALSYAHKNHATMINASLGYYTDTSAIDPFLKYYADLCSTDGIPILAAAGNLPGQHLPPICADAGPGNQLTKKRRFYPAYYNAATAVTGLRDLNHACFYQNYSDDVVAVGVRTPSAGGNCCKFYVDFLSSGYEGTSFATPVVSGLMMGYLLHNVDILPADCLKKVSMVPTSLTGPVTKDGRYIDYIPN